MGFFYLIVYCYKKSVFNDYSSLNEFTDWRQAMKNKISLEKVLSLQAAVKGFHIYKAVWEPKDSEVLACSHEENNLHDPFAIKTCQLDSGKIVGHLPMELSRISKFILDRGAKIEVELRETYYLRSPLVQGGLEIPCDLVITMPNTMKSAELLKNT